MFSSQELNHGRQRGKKESFPLHHGIWRFNQSNKIFKQYGEVQQN